MITLPNPPAAGSQQGGNSLFTITCTNAECLAKQEILQQSRPRVNAQATETKHAQTPVVSSAPTPPESQDSPGPGVAFEDIGAVLRRIPFLTVRGKPPQVGRVTKEGNAFVGDSISIAEVPVRNNADEGRKIENKDRQDAHGTMSLPAGTGDSHASLYNVFEEG